MVLLQSKKAAAEAEAKTDADADVGAEAKLNGVGLEKNLRWELISTASTSKANEVRFEAASSSSKHWKRKKLFTLLLNFMAPFVFIFPKHRLHQTHLHQQTNLEQVI